MAARPLAPPLGELSRRKPCLRGRSVAEPLPSPAGGKVAFAKQMTDEGADERGITPVGTLISQPVG